MVKKFKKSWPHGNRGHAENIVGILGDRKISKKDKHLMRKVYHALPRGLRGDK